MRGGVFKSANNRIVDNFCPHRTAIELWRDVGVRKLLGSRSLLMVLTIAHSFLYEGISVDLEGLRMMIEKDFVAVKTRIAMIERQSSVLKTACAHRQDQLIV